MAHTPPILLETHDAAQILDVSTNWVRTLSRLGRLEPRFETPRGVRLFGAEDVLRLAAERERQAAR